MPFLWHEQIFALPGYCGTPIKGYITEEPVGKPLAFRSWVVYILFDAHEKVMGDIVLMSCGTRFLK